VDKVKPYLADTPKSWIGEAPATEVTELQSENTESANGAEEVVTNTERQRKYGNRIKSE